MWLPSFKVTPMNLFFDILAPVTPHSNNKGSPWQYKLVACHISILQMPRQDHCIWDCIELSSPVLPCTLYHTIIPKEFEHLSYPIVYDFSSLLELLFPNLSYDYACDWVDIHER